MRILLVVLVLLVSSEASAHGGQRRKIRLRHGHNQTMNNEEDDVSTDSSDVFSILQTMNDKLTEITLISNQHLRRFESLDYKITKMEVQMEEKTNSLKAETKEVSRKVQQMDWQSSKMEEALDIIRSDTTFLKQALEHMRSSPQPSEREPKSMTEVGSDVSHRMQVVLRSLQLLQNDVNALRFNMAWLRSNVSAFRNFTSSLERQLTGLLTTQHFQRSLLEADMRGKRECAAPRSALTVADPYPDLPMECAEVAGNKSGVYRIMPPHTTQPFFVFCDMETSSGGWTVIQHRPDGTHDFYRGWHDYKYGFGNVGREHWLGLEKIHLLTSVKVNELYVELEDFSFAKTYAHYDAFSVGSEIEGYAINFLGEYDGTAGDSLTYHAGQKFSTLDMDHDNWAEGSCARSHTGAWWYNGCDTSNLNGKYMRGEQPPPYEFQGMYWYEFQGPSYSLKTSKMMIRPRKDNPN